MKKGDAVWCIGDEDLDIESRFGVILLVTPEFVRYTSFDAAALNSNSWIFNFTYPEVARRFRRAIVSFVGPIRVEVDDEEG